MHLEATAQQILRMGFVADARRLYEVCTPKLPTVAFTVTLFNCRAVVGAASPVKLEEKLDAAHFRTCKRRH